ncbi:MAG: HAD hydrolase-like protein [Holosporaceae bacterium]|jgi:HAD superfamily hydrolase (TIGR01450 family)|nr:HAD hydrolase-like protein [Holosporaceae bacterium]
MDIKKNILSLADSYDTFFVDIYGVLYDGISIYDGALETMQKLKSMGKKLIILSNTTQVSQDAKLGYSQRGMFEGSHYDEMITSGEFLHYFLLNHPKEFSEKIGSSITRVKCLFMGNNSIFDGAHVSKVTDAADADFIYVGVPRASYGSVKMDDIFDGDELVDIEDIVNRNWYNLHDGFGRKGFAEFAHALEACVSKNKVLVVANPDIFAYGSINDSSKKVPIITQGCIGKYYEKLGGKVVYFGKPYPGIFEYAKQFTNPHDRIAMIGDTPWTDIVGANNCNIDSILVMTGITDNFCHQMDHALSDKEKIDVLLDKVAKKMSKFPGNIYPTHVLRRFAKYSQDVGNR